MAFFSPLLTLHWKAAAVKIVGSGKAASGRARRTFGKGKTAQLKGRGGRVIRKGK